jgi:hypothetical protein
VLLIYTSLQAKPETVSEIDMRYRMVWPQLPPLRAVLPSCLEDVELDQYSGSFLGSSLAAGNVSEDDYVSQQDFSAFQLAQVSTQVPSGEKLSLGSSSQKHSQYGSCVRKFDCIRLRPCRDSGYLDKYCARNGLGTFGDNKHGRFVICFFWDGRI